MASQLINSRAHEPMGCPHLGIPSWVFASNSRIGRCASMQSPCRERLSPGAPLRLHRSGAGQSTCKQIQRAHWSECEGGVTSRSGRRWAFASLDGIRRRYTRVCRRLNSCSRNVCYVHGRKMRICAISNLEATGRRPASSASGYQESDTVILDVQGMKGGTCVARVRGLLAADKRAVSVAVSLATQTVAIRLKHSSGLGAGESSNVGAELASLLTGSGFTAKPRSIRKSESMFHKKREEIARKRDQLLNSSGQVAYAFALGAFCFATHATHLLHSVGINNFMSGTISSFLENTFYKACISSLALLGPGRDLLVDGVKALWRRSPNVNSLVGVGAGAFCAISAVSHVFPRLNWDASFFDVPVMLLALVLFGRAMDAQARAEATSGTHALLSALPSRSRLVVSETETGEPTEDETGLVVGVDSEQLRPGDCVLVSPGDVIPVDGKVIKGKSLVDESMFMGRLPSVRKTRGNIVYAGTINREGTLTVEATATGAQSRMGNITEHVEEAQDRNSTVQQLADLLPGSSAFSIMTLSAATFFFWYFVGVYVFPDVLYKGVAASGGSAFLPSLKLTTDVLVVACFCSLGLSTPIPGLLGKSVGAKKRPLARRDDLQKRSVGVDSALSYKDGDRVAGKRDAVSSAEDNATVEAGASCEDIGVKENDDPKGEQPGGTCKKSVAWDDGTLTSTDDSQAEQPDATREDIVASKNGEGLSLVDSKRPGAVVEDSVVRKDDAISSADNSEAGGTSVVDNKAERLGASGEDILARMDQARLPTFDEKAEESGASGAYILAEADNPGPPTDSIKSEEPWAGGGDLVPEDHDARLQTVEYSAKELSACGQSFVSKKDIADLPVVKSEVEETSEKESIAEMDERDLASVQCEAEEHDESKQERVTGNTDDAGSLIVESKVQEQSSVKEDLGARKDNAGLIVVEPEAEELNTSEHDRVAEDEGSENVECKVEERSSSEQNFVWSSERDDADSPNFESKTVEHSPSEQELAAKKGEEGSPTVEIVAEDLKQIRKDDEDKRHGGDEGERPAKKVRKKRETTVSKSGRKRLTKEEFEAGTKTKKKKKDPAAPKRALSAFMCFSQLVREDLKKSQPDLSFSDKGRVLGEMWKNMSAEEKRPFESMAEADKERYKREMQKWSGAVKDDAAKD